MTSSSESQVNQTKLQQTQRQLERAASTNAALAELSVVLFQSETLEDISSLVLDYACQLTRSATGCAGYIDHSTHALVYVPLKLNHDVRSSEAADGPLIFDEWQNLADWMRHNQTPLLTNTPADDPRISEGVEDLTRLRRILSVPVLHDNHLIGQITLANAKEAYSHADLALVQHIAVLYAAALCCQQTVTTERRERMLAQTFQQIAEMISTSNRLEDTLEFALELLDRVVTHDYAEVLLVEGEHLRIVASRCETHVSAPPEDPAARFVYADIPAFYEPLTSGKPLVLVDAQSDQRWTRDIGTDDNTRAWLGVPLIVWDVVLGLLGISSYRIGAYAQAEVETAQAFARQVALAIENSRLYTHLESSEAGLRQVRAHLTQTARLSVAGKIAAGVAHQINNPLTTVIAQTHLLLKQLAPDSPAYEAVDTIRRATYQAGTVVQRLMDFARPSSYVMVPLDLNRTILNAISLIRAQVEPHIARITVDLAPDLPTFQGSEEHLEDIWINLILNARDAIDGGTDGHIHVTSHFVPNRNAIKVLIEDNGTGIASEHLPIIFDPLFTTKEYGTGLGLAVCHDIVVDHGGEIHVTSHEGEGTTFTILLPV